MLAGEASGDNLGAGLMRALRAQTSEDVHFVGIGGDAMLSLGLEPLADMDTLAVNGFRDPILRLPELLRLLRRLIKELANADLDCFVGIDFNVFNFLLEAALKKRGVRTAHYVSPSVYAWRAGRTKRVAKSADLLLCLYPFEPAFYRDTAVRAEFVGHPLADEIGPAAGDEEARRSSRSDLQIPQGDTVLAVLPGSRNSEVSLMLGPFLQAAQRFVAAHAPASIVIACLRVEIRQQIEAALEQYPDLPVTLYEGNARQALIAADVALVKAGTSTLEAMLLHRPMVVSYRLGWLSYQFARRAVRTPFVALPNILAGRALIPELLQYAGTGAALAQAIDIELQQARQDPAYIERFSTLHNDLRQGADVKAATAVLGLLQQEY